MNNQRELLIIVGHAYNCLACREQMLDNPTKVLASHKLDAEAREAIGKLTTESFHNISRLAEMIGTTTAEIYDIMDEPRCRLRHL